MKIFNKKELIGYKEVFLFGQSVYQKVKNPQETSIYILGKGFQERFADKILETIPNEHDLIIIVRTAGLGEAYLLNFMVDEIIKNENAKNPCLVSYNGFYKELFGMYNEIPFYQIDSIWEEINISLKDRNFRYKGKKFKVYHCTFDESQNLFDGIFGTGNGNSYPQEILNFSGIKEFTYKKQEYNQDVKNRVRQYCSWLNKDNFVYLIPEAKSVVALSDDFWMQITSSLKEKGYDIFINTVSGISKYGKSEPLNVAEAAYLSSLAKGIVSVRCGFLEIVSTHEIPKHVVYTPHRVNEVSATEMLRSSTLVNYPFVNTDTLFEYNTDESSEEEIMQTILKDF